VTTVFINKRNLLGTLSSVENGILIVSGLVLSILVIVIYLKLHALTQVSQASQDKYQEVTLLNAELAKVKVEYAYSQTELMRLKEECQQISAHNQMLSSENKTLTRANLELASNVSRLEVENEHLTSAYQQLQQTLAELKLQLNAEFTTLKNLAVNELKERAEGSLREIGKESVVAPLQEYLKDLQTKITELHFQTKEINRNSEGLNEQARNLALALTKDSKKKGDFGEMILSNILESVGLSKYLCYIEQQQIVIDDKRLIPDVIVKLPHNKAVVVDSKNIMQRYYESIVEQSDKTKAIIDALRSTLKSFSNKDYIAAVTQAVDALVLDYAIMFIPNEGLFSLIIEEDQKQHGQLLKEAYHQRVFIAGPSTLLVLLGMIEQSWEIYQVEERAQAILKLATELNDKFKTSLTRLAELGVAIRKTGRSYDDVIKSLDNGASNSAIAKLANLAHLAGDKQGLNPPSELGALVPRLPSSLAEIEEKAISTL
jgi:DNA recombination protein RmuC